jgi:hypothetical protein
MKMNEKKEIKKITQFVSAVNERQTTEECKFASDTFVKYVYSTGVYTFNPYLTRSCVHRLSV